MSRSVLNFISLLCKLFPGDWMSSPLEGRWRAIQRWAIAVLVWMFCSISLARCIGVFYNVNFFLSSSQGFWVFLLYFVAAIPSILKSVSLRTHPSHLQYIGKSDIYQGLWSHISFFPIGFVGRHSNAQWFYAREASRTIDQLADRLWNMQCLWWSMLYNHMR